MYSCFYLDITTKTDLRTTHQWLDNMFELWRIFSMVVQFPHSFNLFKECLPY